MLIDYLEISDDIARHRPPTALILRYYQAFLSPIILDIVPFAFLVAALVTIASLVRSAETTALLAHGVSLHRATAPLVVLAAAAGAGLFVFAERVVPAAASESDRIRFLLKGQKPPHSGAGGAWFRGEAGRFLAADAYDPASRVASGATVLRIDPARWRLVSRQDATRARLVPGKVFSRRAAGSGRFPRATRSPSGATIPSSSRRPKPRPASRPAGPTRVR